MLFRLVPLGDVLLLVVILVALQVAGVDLVGITLDALGVPDLFGLI